MNNFQLLFAAGFATPVVLSGILLNRQDTNMLRMEIQALPSDLTGRTDLLTGKVMGLTGGVSHLEARMGK
jgi:hypothetical protein